MPRKSARKVRAECVGLCVGLSREEGEEYRGEIEERRDRGQEEGTALLGTRGSSAHSGNR